MGMVVALHTISDENISRVLADPPLIWRVIAPDDPEIYEHARSGRKPGFLARLLGSKADDTPTEIPNLSFSEGEGAEFDLDKSWHGIHYLLTGTAWDGPEPVNFLVCGGTQVGDVDVGYGPARVFGSQDVARISTALAELDSQSLRDRFDPDEMMNLEIYPEIWDRDPADDDTLAYCLEFFDDLKRFLGNANENRMGAVIYVC